MYFGQNDSILNNAAAVQRFAHVLSENKILETLDIYLHMHMHMHLSSTVTYFDSETATRSFSFIIQALEEPSNVKDLRLSGLRSQECINQLIASLPRMKSIQRLIVDGFDVVMLRDEFIPALRQNTSLQVLPGISHDGHPRLSGIAVAMNTILTRNRSLNQVGLLLAPPPQPTTSMMFLKIWHKAIVKFAMVPNNAGCSAIYKLFQARPALLEKRIKRPAPASVLQDTTTITTTARHDSIHNNGGGSSSTNNNKSTTNHGPIKRLRL